MVFVLDNLAKIEADRIVTDSSVVTTNDYKPEKNIFENPVATVRKIEVIVRDYIRFSENYDWRPKTIEIYSIFHEAFFNADMWGTENVPGRKITTTIKYGLAGSVIYLEDEGEGFDFAAQIAKLGQGEAHEFSHHGKGIIQFHHTLFSIRYHGKGNVISIATPLSQEEMQTPEYQKLRRSLD